MSNRANIPLTLDQRAQIHLAVAQIDDVSKQLDRNLIDLPGGLSVYETCPLERHFHDAHAVPQHVLVSPNNFAIDERAILGEARGVSSN
jgi:hypothetical protein